MSFRTKRKTDFIDIQRKRSETLKIRILHITTALLNSGGIEETIRILCRRIDPVRFRIGLCSIRNQLDEIPDELRKMDIDIFCIGRKGYFFDFITTLQIRKIIKIFNADIVHTHRNKANLHGRIAAALITGAKIVTTHHDMEDSVFSKTPVLKKLKRCDVPDKRNKESLNWINTKMYPFLNIALNRLNTKVIAVSNCVRNVYTPNPKDTRFETVYAPYDETMFTPHYKGLKNSHTMLGTVGRLSWHKGHIILLQTIKLLLQTYDDISLKIIGDGELKPRIEKFIHEEGLNSYVDLCGDMPHNANLYDNIDIYVQPSVSEGSSITILEAMGVGIPVIASNIDGPKELIRHGENGILVPAENPEALKKAILFLIENREKAMELAKTGSKRVKENFSSEIFIKKMTRIYEEVKKS